MFEDSPSFFNKECLVSSPHNGDVLGVVSRGFERERECEAAGRVRAGLACEVSPSCTKIEVLLRNYRFTTAIFGAHCTRSFETYLRLEINSYSFNFVVFNFCEIFYNSLEE